MLDALILPVLDERADAAAPPEPQPAPQSSPDDADAAAFDAYSRAVVTAVDTVGPAVARLHVTKSGRRAAAARAPASC